VILLFSLPVDNGYQNWGNTTAVRMLNILKCTITSAAKNYSILNVHRVAVVKSLCVEEMLIWVKRFHRNKNERHLNKSGIKLKK
jgi:hypothetical protein